MKYNNNIILLVYFLLLLLFILPISYSINLNLDLEEGGCAGYENGLLELYYDNDTLVNSSNIEITIYNGPIEGLGELATFTSDQTPYNIMFNQSTDYLYTISTNNNTLYTGLEGRISIYECREKNSQNKDRLDSSTLDFENKLSITYLTNSTDTTNFAFQLMTVAPNNLLVDKLEEEYERNSIEIEYYNLSYEGNNIVNNITLESDLNISLFNETGE